LLAGWLAGWLAGVLACWFVDMLVCLLACWLAHVFSACGRLCVSVFLLSLPRTGRTSQTKRQNLCNTNHVNFASSSSPSPS
jgi:hypothetical protein